MRKLPDRWLEDEAVAKAEAEREYCVLKAEDGTVLLRVHRDSEVTAQEIAEWLEDNV